MKSNISRSVRRTTRIGIEAILICACFLLFHQRSGAELSCPVEFVLYNGHCGFIGSNGKFRPVFKLTQPNIDYSKQFVYSEFWQGRNPNWERAVFPQPIDRNLLAGSSNGSGSTSSEKAAPLDGVECDMGCDDRRRTGVAGGAGGANQPSGRSAETGGGSQTGKPTKGQSQDGTYANESEGASPARDRGVDRSELQATQNNQTSNGSGSAGDSASGAPWGFPQRSEIEADREYCSLAKKQASICCNDPVQCVTGLSGPSAGTITAVGSIAMGAMSMFAMQGTASTGSDGKADTAGIKKSCELMKILAIGGAAANTALGAKCYSDKSTCESNCEELSNKYRKVISACDQLEKTWKANGGSGQRCGTSLVSEYRSAMALGGAVMGSCQAFNANISQMGGQAAQSAAASGFASLCSDVASAQEEYPNIDPQPVFNGDCNDPVNASNPICVNCRGPAAASDPLCAGLNTGNNNSSGAAGGFSGPDFGVRSVDGSDLNVTDLSAQQQGPQFGNGAGEAARANQIPNNGGGFAGGQGGGGSPLAGGGGGQGQGPGYDTDVLKGLGGGGGYSSGEGAVATETRGGYNGPPSESDKRSANPFTKFDLKRYLPGGERDSSGRGPSGSESGAAAIGKASENIFEKISNRYRIMCKQKRFYGCE
ncbi:MAG: hypothetical protein IPJ71_07190 [Bdellovibrionales bacterium]|nr:hypothetical protein [Bdellovibrionales bacterium]